jgi:DNA polymerase I
MAPELPRLFLVDGSSYVFRAFFAIPSLTSSSGLPTNAIYGFSSMLLKFIKEHRPDYLSVVLDAGRETFRNEIFQDYKKHRPEAPPALVPQFPYIRKVLNAMKVAVLELQGFEADDLIGTLCRLLSNKECEIIIVSGDKDLMQLVNGEIKILDTSKERWIGVEEVRQKFGVEPRRVVEVMGLMGDAVDNIPGVRGIGEKTAIALIQRFDSLEHLYDRLDEVEKTNLRGSARIRKALEQGKDAAFLSRELATVKTDVSIRVQLEDLRFRGPDMEGVRQLFTELGFDNLLKLIEKQNTN